MIKNGTKILDIEKIMSEMTLEEKAGLVCASSLFGTSELKRLGISKMQLLDGGTGMNFEQYFTDMVEGIVDSNSLARVIEYFYEPDRLLPEDMALYENISSRLCKLVGIKYSPGCYPPGIVLGSTWNPEVVYKVGEALGLDAVVFCVDFLLGSPNVNIHRDPLNGRLFEGYSEDPVLVSKLAPELVKGVQKYGIAANVKHFAANNQETYRAGIDEIISNRALEEIYFPGFKACVDAGVVSIMSAYNKINGVSCTENHDLLTKKIRDEWGFDGMILSDWGAIRDVVAALKAGNDLATPGPFDFQPVIDGVLCGNLDIDVLDKAVYRILKTINWISQNKKDINMSVDELTAFTNEAAYNAAVEAVVLLENNGVLPLSDNDKIAVMGSPSYDSCGAIKPLDTIIECGSGSAGINTDRKGSLRKSISAYVPEDNVSLGEVREDTDIILYVLKIPGMEGNDKKSLKIPDYDVKALNELISKKTGFGIKKKLVVVLNISGPVEFTGVDVENIDGMLAIFLPGMEGCHALADILFGRANPSGKLPVTFPMRYEDAPTYINFPGDGYNVTYGEGIFVGYRYYDKKKITTRYPVGYGLSYTSFNCELKGVYKDDVSCTSVLKINVNVKNTGLVFGSQVVQIYVSDVMSTLSKPVKELKAFKKVALNPGEEKNVSFALALDELAAYDADLGKWIVEEGYYDIIAATSSAAYDIFGQERVYIDVKSPYSYGINTIIKTLYEHSELKAELLGLWNEYGFDEGILNSNYQYTSGNRLTDIVPLEDDTDLKLFEEKFMERIKHIKKI